MSIIFSCFSWITPGTYSLIFFKSSLFRKFLLQVFEIIYNQKNLFLLFNSYVIRSSPCRMTLLSKFPEYLAWHIRNPSLWFQQERAGSPRRRKLEARQSRLSKRLFHLEANQRKDVQIPPSSQNFVFFRILRVRKSRIDLKISLFFTKCQIFI